jgi:hypothetical protein
MLRPFLRLAFLLLVAAGWALGQQTSGLVGTWIGKVQGFEVEMKLVLNADGSADYEGKPGTWRTQGNRLLLSQEGETTAYEFRLQGSQLTLSGGDLMAPLALTRAGSAPRAARGAAPSIQEPEQSVEGPAPPTPESAESGEAAPPARAARPAGGKRALAESEVVELLEAGVPPRRLVDLVEERGITFTLTPAVAARLKAKGATEQLLAALRSAGGAQRGVQPSAAAAPSAPRPTTARAASARGPSGAAPGRRFNYEKWGLSFRIPGDWKVGERSGALLLGSDTEAGLMIIRFLRRTNLQALAEGYQEGMQEEGLQLAPTTQLENFTAGGNQGLAGEMAGMAQDGARIRARAVGVPSPFGDAAVIFGLTTEEKYAGLKPRVDALASTFSFAEPPAGAGAGPEFLAGQYYYISTSSYGSTERYIDMCSDGRFSSRTGTYSTGDAGTGYGEGGQSAQWTAEGDENQGAIIVTNPNGETERYEYRRSGSDLIVNGRTFARYGDGSCTKTSVY